MRGHHENEKGRSLVAKHVNVAVQPLYPSTHLSTSSLVGSGGGRGYYWEGEVDNIDHFLLKIPSQTVHKLAPAWLSTFLIHQKVPTDLDLQ